MDGLKRYVNDDRFRVDGDKNMRFLAFAFTIVFVWTRPKSLMRANRASLKCEAREKKPYFLASLPSLALCFQPRAYLNTQKYGLFCSLGACGSRASCETLTLCRRLAIWGKKMPHCFVVYPRVCLVIWSLIFDFLESRAV